MLKEQDSHWDSWGKKEEEKDSERLWVRGRLKLSLENEPEKEKIETSSQAKRHKSSFFSTSLTILTFLINFN